MLEELLRTAYPQPNRQIRNPRSFAEERRQNGLVMVLPLPVDGISDKQVQDFEEECPVRAFRTGR